MASQRPLRPVVAYNYKLVGDYRVKANGAIIAPKAVPAVAVARAKTPELDDNIYDDNSSFDTQDTSILLSTP
jgi:hypothetical protein